jgi:hypothetical protein
MRLAYDTAHTLIGTAALVLMAGGAWLAWGPGYAALLVGALLLAGVIYARTR